MKDDTISRQQFVDAFWKTEVEFRPSQIDEVMRILEQLPSAQFDKDINVPDKNVGKIGDLIDRQAAIDAIAKMMPTLMSADGSHPADADVLKAQEIFVDCMETIEILPSAQPEIIHCRECKYGDFCFQVGDEDGNGFCSDAKRREEGGE